MLEYIDELLKTDNRAMTHLPELIMSGSTGNRVYGAFSKGPGLCGVFHFVHKSDFVDLLELDFKGMVCPVKLSTVYEWRPSHLSMKHEYPCFVMEEKKFITENDLVVGRICIKSVSGNIKFKLGLKSAFLDQNFEKSVERFGQKINIKAFCSEHDIFSQKEIILEEGQQICFTVACGFKVEQEQWPGYIHSFEQHRSEYGKFYKGIPKLTCSDKDMEKIYYYRWFLLKHHMANPKLGNIQYPILYEGRYGYFAEPGMDPDEVVEWEFSKGILASTPHHLLDMRWHRNAEILKGEILNYTENLGRMEKFLGYEYDIPLLPGCIRIHDFVGHYFFHMLPYVVWQIYETTKDKKWLKRVETALWEDLNNWSKYDPENSGLPVMIYEGDSAMEFGPASHYHIKDESKDESKLNISKKSFEIGMPCNCETQKAKWGEPVSNRRTEVAVFYGLNYYAFHKIYGILGNENKAEFCFNKYNSIKAAVINLMWNGKMNFFVELTEDFQAIDEVKQVGGIFCLLLVNPEKPKEFLENLTDAQKFNQKYGIASTSKDSFGYFPNNTVNGTRAHTCMWNGPTWPFSTSFALLAVGSYIKRLQDTEVKAQYVQYFKEEFAKYTQLHFRFGKRDDPCIVEHYNCETGVPLSGQDDYNHSCYIDIIVRMVCGLDMDENGEIVFSPMDLGFEFIRLERIPFNEVDYCVEIRGKNAVLYSNGIKIKEITD